MRRVQVISLLWSMLCLILIKSAFIQLMFAIFFLFLYFYLSCSHFSDCFHNFLKNHRLSAILLWYLGAVFFKFILLLVHCASWIFLNLWACRPLDTFSFLVNHFNFLIDDWQANHAQVLNLLRSKRKEYWLINSGWHRNNQFDKVQGDSIHPGIKSFLSGVRLPVPFPTFAIYVLWQVLGRSLACQDLTFPISKMGDLGLLKPFPTPAFQYSMI